MSETGSPGAMLAEFHRLLNDPFGRGNARLWITLHCEEHDELLAELHNLAALEPMEDMRDLSEARKALARELADVVYTTYGTAHAFGIDLDAAVREIHRAAMSKLVRPNGDPPVVREDGKILKPPEFVPPNMAEAIAPLLTPLGEPDYWRVGRKVGRTIYAQIGPEPSDDDPLIGVMDTAQIAQIAVDAHNRALDDGLLRAEDEEKP